MIGTNGFFSVLESQNIEFEYIHTLIIAQNCAVVNALKYSIYFYTVLQERRSPVSQQSLCVLSSEYQLLEFPLLFKLFKPPSYDLDLVTFKRFNIAAQNLEDFKLQNGNTRKLSILGKALNCNKVAYIAFNERFKV